MPADKILDVIRRNVGPVRPTLNAYTAIRRIEQLIEEFEDFRSQNNSDDARNRPTFYNYNTVAVATCFEWHARSRLVDYLTHSPEKLEAKDIETIKGIALKVADRLTTVAELVGAYRKINSAEDYVSIFDRIFSSFGIKEKTWDMIRDVSVVNGENYLDLIFKKRHELVHEIQLSQVGPYDVREHGDVNTSVVNLQTALRIINQIEQRVSTKLPIDFPNKIDGPTKVEVTESLSEIVGGEILSVMKKFIDGADQDWVEFKREYDELYSRQQALVDKFEIIRPVRWLDFRVPLKQKIAENRLEVYKFIRDIFVKI